MIAVAASAAAAAVIAYSAVDASPQEGDVEQPPAYQDADQRYQRRDDRGRRAARP
jgi:hypothetical protein